MYNFKKYVRATSLDEAYELYQKRPNAVAGGMLWLKMGNVNAGTVIDLCDLGLDKIEETEDSYVIGAYVTLRQLEVHEELNRYTSGAFRDALRPIVGVQFRNVATVGGSMWGRFGFSDVLTLFMALGAKVQLHKAGLLTIDEFKEMPRTQRDILTAIVVPKTVKRIVYMSQRNVSTDFPVLTCAVAETADGITEALGATPHIARHYEDVNGLLAGGITEESAADFGQYISENGKFAGNMRAGAEYRKRMSSVLTRRALLKLRELPVNEIQQEG